MKLDSALKLYIVLYVVSFLLTWLVSIPMLIHVTPQSECLLFVTPYIQYGSAFTCNLVGIVPLFVAIAALVLILLHAIQLRSLYAFLRKGGNHSSDYHHRPTHIFWRLVLFHGIVTLVVLVIAAITTAGYVSSCQNLHREVKQVLRGRIKPDLYGGGIGTNDLYDRYDDTRSLERYTNPNRNSYGDSRSAHSITCRKIFRDPDIHWQLKQNHLRNPYYSRHTIFYNDNENADVGNIHYHTYRNNLILELCMTGVWLSFALWLSILILMILERRHLKANLYDESVLGSDFGGSRRSGSRMSNQSFDKMSQSRYSNFSGASGSRRSGGTGYGSRRHQQAMANISQASRNHTPAGNGYTQRIPPPAYQTSLMDYFVQNPPQEEEVDVDAALEEMADPGVSKQTMDYQDVSALDASFELQASADVSDGLGGPYPLGDDVSEGRAIRNVPVNIQNAAEFQQPGLQQTDFQQPQYFEQPPPQQVQSNTARVTGRRGGRMRGGPQPLQQPQPPQQRDFYPTTQQSPHYPIASPSQDQSYRTHLGNQSMI